MQKAFAYTSFFFSAAIFLGLLIWAGYAGYQIIGIKYLTKTTNATIQGIDAETMFPEAKIVGRNVVYREAYIEVRVRYSYSVDGEDYSLTKLYEGLGPSGLMLDPHPECVSQFLRSPPLCLGDVEPMHYFTWTPGTASLYKKETTDYWWHIIIAVVCMVLAFLWARLSWKDMKGGFKTYNSATGKWEVLEEEEDDEDAYWKIEGEESV